MSEIKSKVTVIILGESYCLKGDSEPERILEIAKLLDSRMKQAALSCPRLPTSKIAVLTALNIIEDFLRLEKDYKQLIKMVKDVK